MNPSGSGTALAGSDFFSQPIGGGVGGLIARGMRQREGVPFDAPVSGTPGIDGGGSQLFESLDSLIVRYVDFALATYYGQTTIDDFSVHVTGSNPLGSYTFDATVTFDYSQTVAGGALTIDNTDSFSYAFSESGLYADGTGFTFSNNGSVNTTVTGSGTTATQTLNGVLRGSDTYTLDEAKTDTLTFGTGVSTQTQSLRHSGSDTFSLNENRTATYAGGTIASGRHVYNWNESNNDTHTFQQLGNLNVITVNSGTGTNTWSQTFNNRETGSDGHALTVTATETFGAGGRLTGGNRSFSWGETGSDSLTQTAEGRWFVPAIAGGGYQTGGFTSSFNHADDSTRTQRGTNSFTGSGNDSNFTWGTAGTLTYSTTETATETFTNSYSSTISQAIGSVVSRGDAASTLDSTATSSGNDTFATTHRGSQSLTSGALAAALTTFTWQSSGEDDRSLTQSVTRASTDYTTTSWTFALGSGSQINSNVVAATNTFNSNATDTPHALTVTATITAGEHGAVTSGNVRRSWSQSGPVNDGWEENTTVTSTGSGTDTWSAGGTTSSGTSTLTDVSTASSSQISATTSTLGVTEVATIGVGGVISSGSITQTLNGTGAAYANQELNGTRTLRSTDTVVTTLGGYYSSGTFTSGSTLNSSVTGSQGVSNLSLGPTNTFAQSTTLQYSAGGRITAGWSSGAWATSVAPAIFVATNTTTETGSNSSTMTYQEGSLLLRGSSSGSYGNRLTATVDQTASSSSSGSFADTFGLSGIAIFGQQTAAYVTTLSHDRSTMQQAGSQTQNESSTLQDWVAGAFSSVSHSGGYTQTYSNSGGTTGSQTLAQTSTLTHTTNRLPILGQATSNLRQTYSSNPVTTSLTERSTWSDTFSSTLASAGSASNGSDSGGATSTLIQSSSKPLTATLTQTATQSVGLGGAIVSGNSSFTYHEDTHSGIDDFDKLNVTATSSNNRNLRSSSTMNFGGNTGTSTSSYTYSSTFGNTFTDNASRVYDRTGYVSLTLGGVIHSGQNHTTYSGDGLTGGTSTESGSESGFDRNSISLNTGGASSSQTSSNSFSHSFSQTPASLTTTYAAQSTVHQTLGVSGAITGGNSYSTYRENGTIGAYAITDNTTTTLTNSSGQTDSFHQAFSQSGGAASSTLTTSLTSSIAGGTFTLNQTSTVVLSSGGTIASATHNSTWSNNSTGNWRQVDTGTKSGSATSNYSFREGPDTIQGNSSQTWSNSSTASESLAYVSDGDGSSSVTLGTNGMITGGSGRSRQESRSTAQTQTLSETGTQTSSLTTSGNYPAKSNSATGGTSGSDDSTVRQTASYTTTHGGTGSSTQSQTYVESRGTGGTILSGQQTSTLYETSSASQTDTESGSVTSTYNNNYGVNTSHRTTAGYSNTLTHSETHTYGLRDVTTLGTGGTIASGNSLSTLTLTVAETGQGGRNGTSTITSSEVAKSGSLVEITTLNGNQSLVETNTLSYGPSGTVTGGSRWYTDISSYSDSLSQTLFGGPATYTNQIGGPAFTGVATDHTIDVSTLSTRESGTVTFGANSSITGGSNTYTWSELRQGEDSVGIAGSHIALSDVARSTFSLYEVGTETLGTSGTIVSGTDSFTWIQNGDNVYSLAVDDQTSSRTYSLTLSDSSTTSWRDVGNESLGAANVVRSATDSYTWDQRRTTSYYVEDYSVNTFGATYDLSGQGTWDLSVHNVGDSTHSSSSTTSSFSSTDGYMGGHDTFDIIEDAAHTGSLAYIVIGTGTSLSLNTSGSDSFNLNLHGENTRSGSYTYALHSYTLNNEVHNQHDWHRTLTGQGNVTIVADVTDSDNYNIYLTGTSLRDGNTSTSAAINYNWSQDHDRNVHVVNRGETIYPSGGSPFSDSYSLDESLSYSFTRGESGGITNNNGSQSRSQTYDYTDYGYGENHGVDALGTGTWGGWAWTSNSHHSEVISNSTTFSSTFIPTSLASASGTYTGVAGFSPTGGLSQMSQTNGNAQAQVVKSIFPTPNDDNPLTAATYRASRPLIGAWGYSAAIVQTHGIFVTNKFGTVSLWAYDIGVDEVFAPPLLFPPFRRGRSPGGFPGGPGNQWNGNGFSQLQRYEPATHGFIPNTPGTHNDPITPSRRPPIGPANSLHPYDQVVPTPPAMQLASRARNGAKAGAPALGGGASAFAAKGIGLMADSLGTAPEEAGRFEPDQWSGRGFLPSVDQGGVGRDLRRGPDSNAIASAHSGAFERAYDAATRSVRVTDGNGNTTTIDHDTDGNVTAVTDPNGNTTSYTYDERGLLVKMTDPLGNSATYSYDEQGRLSEATDRNGRRRTFAYDDQDRLVAEDWYDADGNLVDSLRFSYDDQGRLLSASNREGTYTYTYDDQGRLIRQVDPHGQSLAYAYETVGETERVTVTDSAGGVSASTYDLLGRLVSRELTTPGHETISVAFAYDAAGRLASVTRTADGTKVGSSSYTYDAAGNLVEIVHADAAGNILDRFSYTYDNAGRVTSATDHASTSGSAPDPELDDLTAVTTFAAAAAAISPATPASPAERIASAITTTYTYDAAGQLIGAGADTYSYDANGNRNGPDNVIGPANQLLADANGVYEYDAEGNRIRKTDPETGVSWSYTYDNANRLTSATEYDTKHQPRTEVTYTYDVFGNRIERTSRAAGEAEPTVERFTYDGQVLRADLDANNQVTTRYLLGDAVDQLLAREDAAGNVDWYLTDRLGSIRDVVDNAGTVLDHIDYDAFGNIIAETNPALGDRFKFTGREYDEATGLNYKRARYYDSQTGTWISQDPLGFDAGDQNLYRYVGNEPTNFTDPSGLAPPAPGGNWGGGWNPWNWGRWWLTGDPNAPDEYYNEAYNAAGESYSQNSGKAHTALDAAGMVPGAGALADGVNIVLSVAEGNNAQAAATAAGFGGGFVADTAIKATQRAGAPAAAASIPFIITEVKETGNKAAAKVIENTGEATKRLGPAKQQKFGFMDEAEASKATQQKFGFMDEADDFQGPLRGNQITLPNVKTKPITYKKIDTETAKAARSKFDSTDRPEFLKSLANDPQNAAQLKKSGLTETDIDMMKLGKVPTGYQVHHKIPIDAGGSNAPSNLILMKNDPYHLAITNYQNNLIRGMKPGEVKQFDYPVPEGFIYP